MPRPRTLHESKVVALVFLLKTHVPNLSDERYLDLANQIIDALILVEETGMTPQEAKGESEIRLQDSRVDITDAKDKNP